MTTVSELNAELVRLSKLLDEAHAELGPAVARKANAIADYRKAKAQAFVTVPHPGRGATDAWKAAVDAEVADLKAEALLAEGMAQAALELVRSRRGQLSALQTIAGGHREEAKYGRTGTEPDYQDRDFQDAVEVPYEVPSFA